MSIPMALADFIPVVLFLIASFTLMHDLYHMMSKGAFALFAAGMIVILTAGFYKASWKLLYAMNICDFTALNQSFFPMQSTGFMLGGIGMAGLLFFRQKRAIMTAVPAVFGGTMIFVFFTIIGTALIWGGMTDISAKMKKKNCMILFLVSFVCMLGMGYLSSKDFTNPMFNWIGEFVNIAGMSLFLCGVKLLHKAGLETFEMH